MFLVIKRNTQHQDNLHGLKAAAHILLIKKKSVSLIIKRQLKNFS